MKAYSTDPKVTMAQMEEKFGPLARFEPKTTFVHFLTTDSMQVDCIRHEDGRFTVLSQSKPK